MVTPKLLAFHGDPAIKEMYLQRRRTQLIVWLAQFACILVAGILGGWRGALYVTVYVLVLRVIDKGIDLYFDRRKVRPAKERKWW